MLKENKWKVILSSVVILLPMVFGLVMWDQLPDTMTTHWGADGSGDGSGTKAFAVFGLPVILLVLHIVCLLFTALDRRQKEQNKKALNIVFCVVPFISLFTGATVYATALGKTFDFLALIPCLLGIMFVLIGNYLPKIKQNRTLGIRLPWTLGNEENWNKTHRLAGKVWVITGLLALFAVFLPRAAMVPVTVCAILPAVGIPAAYSYCIYKKHQKEGVAYVDAPKGKGDKIVARITAVVVPIILIGTAVFMFTGNIEVHCGDRSLQINATYWADLGVDYSEIDTLAYRDDLDTGVRTSGFGSAKLAMGTFQNDEFGPYTLYAYAGAKEYIVLTSGEKNLVIGLKDAEETQELYQTILAKLEQ